MSTSTRPDLQVAALVDDDMLTSLSGGASVFDLSTQAPDPERLPGDVVVISLAQEGAGALIEAYAFQRTDAAMLIIGDDLNAGQVRALLRFANSDVLAGYSSVEDVWTAINALADQRDASGIASPAATCWAFVGAVGGSGVTTLAIETAFAAAGADRNASVCLIDLNLAFGMVSSFLDASPKLDLKSLADNPRRLDESLIRNYAWKHPRGVSVIAASRDPAADQIATEDAVLSLLDIACSVYSRVILDLPRHRLSWTSPVFAAIDRAVVVSELTVPSLHAGADLCRDIDAVRAGAAPSLFVLNRMFAKKKHRASFPMDRAEAAIRRKIDLTIRSDWEAAREAVNLGVPIVEAVPKSPVVFDIAQLLEKLSNTEGALTTDVAAVR